jgi:hypothetical protein
MNIACTHIENEGDVYDFKFRLGDERYLLLCERCKQTTLTKIVDDEYSRGVVFREPFASSKYND